MSAEMRSSAHSKGFTLVEAMVTVAVLGILLAVAIPNFSDFVRKKRLEGVAKEFVADLALARSEVISSGQGNNRLARIQFEPNGTCYVLYAYKNLGSPGCDCRRGIGAACRVASAELKVVTPPAGSGIVFRSEGDGDYLTFLEGFQTRMDAYKVTIKYPAGPTLRVEVKKLGTASICSPDGSVSGHEPCTLE